MSDFYLQLQGTAGRLLGGRGRSMTLRKRTPAAYDPTTGAAGVAQFDTECVGAQFPFPALLIDGTRVQTGDQKVLLSAAGLTVEPDTGDQMLIGGSVFSIVSVQPIGPDGTVVVYKLQVRR